jgi:hypothetical protein
MTEEKLVKIRVDLPEHWAGVSGESMWTIDLGNDEYELQNIPFYAYGLNLGDVVWATAAASDQKPQAHAVRRRSGHETLRIIFFKPASAEFRTAVLKEVESLGCEWEGLDDDYFAVDVPPSVDYEAVRDYLRLQPEDELDYETCETQVAGSFSSAPSADDDIDSKG